MKKWNGADLCRVHLVWGSSAERKSKGEGNENQLPPKLEFIEVAEIIIFVYNVIYQLEVWDCRTIKWHEPRSEAYQSTHLQKK